MQKKIIKTSKILFLVISVYFIIRFFYKNLEEFKTIEIQFSIHRFIIAFIFFVLYKIMLGFLWHYITVIYKVNINIRKSLITFFYSLLGKYIPGKFFLLGARLYFYDKEGISKKKITICFLIENMCTLLGAAFLFLISMLFISKSVLYQYIFIVLFFVLLLFIGIYPPILEKVINFILMLLKKEKIELEIRYLDIFKIVIGFIINWLVVGVGFYMLVNSIYPISIEYLMFVSGVFGLAVIIGIISLFAPSGIGVREGIIILGLGYIMPESTASIISIISRLWSNISELLVIILIIVYGWINNIKFQRIEN